MRQLSEKQELSRRELQPGYQLLLVIPAVELAQGADRFAQAQIGPESVYSGKLAEAGDLWGREDWPGVQPQEDP